MRLANELDRTQPATRRNLRARNCRFDKTAHCHRCKHKVELWKSSDNKGFYVDVLPAGDDAVITMHRNTCKATRIDLPSEIEAFRDRHDAVIVVVLTRDTTSFACHPNCMPVPAREALFAAANHLEQHLRSLESHQ